MTGGRIKKFAVIDNIATSGLDIAQTVASAHQ